MVVSQRTYGTHKTCESYKSSSQSALFWKALHAFLCYNSDCRWLEPTPRRCSKEKRMEHRRRRPRPGHCHHEYALMLVLIVGVCVGAFVWFSHQDLDGWVWEGGSALVWACLSFLLFVVLLAALTFVIFFWLFVIDLVRARTPGARGVLVHDFRVFTVLFFACVFLLLVLVLALPLLLLCIPVWLVALTLEGVETLRRARTARRLARLRHLGKGGRGPAAAANLRFTVRLLGDRDDE